MVSKLNYVWLQQLKKLSRQNKLKTIGFWGEQLLEEFRILGVTSIVNLKTRQIILGGFLWLLMNWQMLLILLTCYLLKEWILPLKRLKNYLLQTVCIVKTIGKYIFEEIERILTQYNLKGNLLRCLPNDGGKTKQKKGLVTQIYKAYELVRHSQAGSLWKILNESCIIETVLMGSFTYFCRLNHYKFCK